MNLSLPAELNAEIQSRIESIMSSCSFIGGKWVEQFEEHFAEYIGVGHCIAVGNGTDAIEIAIEAIGLRDAEIIVPALTAVPTAEAVVRSGNTVRFCDVNKDTLTVDICSLKDCITDRTQAIILVHLYGQPCDMSILQIANECRLWVIEDCSHAHGAICNGGHVGTHGDVGVFSFYPTKPLGAMGDAGAIVTQSDAVAKCCHYIRNHGRLSRDDFRIIGRNSRMDAVQAAVLDAKLPYLDQWNETRREIAARYQDRLNIPVQLSQTYHQLVVQVGDRDTIQAALREVGIETLVHYPYIIPDLFPYRTEGDWPVARRASERVLSLPMDLHITDDDIAAVSGIIS